MQTSGVILCIQFIILLLNLIYVGDYSINIKEPRSFEWLLSISLNEDSIIYVASLL